MKTTFATALVFITTPAIGLAYNIDLYNVGYLPDNLDEAISYQESKRCAEDLESFDTEYLDLADRLEKSYQPKREENPREVMYHLEQLGIKYNSNFADCVRYAISRGDEPLESENEKTEQEEYKEKLNDSDEEIDNLKEQLRQANRDNAALKEQVQQLIAMVQQMLQMGFTTPQ